MAARPWAGGQPREPRPARPASGDRRAGGRRPARTGGGAGGTVTRRRCPSGRDRHGWGGRLARGRRATATPGMPGRATGSVPGSGPPRRSRAAALVGGAGKHVPIVPDAVTSRVPVRPGGIAQLSFEHLPASVAGTRAGPRARSDTWSDPAAGRRRPCGGEPWRSSCWSPPDAVKPPQCYQRWICSPTPIRTAPRDVRALLSAPAPDAVLVDARSELVRGSRHLPDAAHHRPGGAAAGGGQRGRA